jgi:acid phosphatase family membrane protein YuiD
MDIAQYRVLLSVLLAWFVAQFLKPFVHYARVREWEWARWFGAGGMPSSHSAVVVSATYALGLQNGFDSPMFALGVAVCMVVLYDAAGIRRQAGEHARIINAIIDDLAHGHPLKEEHLKELLGHTPGEVVTGMITGIAAAHIVMTQLA